MVSASEPISGAILPKTVDELAAALDLGPAALFELARAAPRLWRRRVVPKESGGKRVLWAPDDDLKKAQKKIQRLLDRLPERSAMDWATKGRGPYQVAQRHCGARWIGKIDIRACFDSIPRERVAKVFERLGFTPEAVDVLCHLTTRAGQLVQGSPASPALAALVLAEMTPAILEEADRLGVAVTPWVDDFPASGSIRSAVAQILDRVTQEAARLGLETHKRRIASRADALVLGYGVRHRTPHVLRSYIGRLRQDLRWARKRGVTPKKRRSLEGRIRYVELGGHAHQARRLRRLLANC